MNLSLQKYKLVNQYACLGLFFGMLLSFNVHGADKNGSVIGDDTAKHTSDGESANEGLQQTLNLNFSPENRDKIRRALDDYSRAADPDHKQIEERRRLMRESIELRFLAVDKDNDGSIDRQEATEFLPQVARHFSEVDTNQDEVITLEELQVAQARFLEHRKANELLQAARKQQEAESAAAASVAAGNSKRKPRQVVTNVHKNTL